MIHDSNLTRNAEKIQGSTGYASMNLW